MYYFNCLCHDLYFKASCVVKHHFFLKNDLKIPHLLYIRDINRPLNPAIHWSKMEVGIARGLKSQLIFIILLPKKLFVFSIFIMNLCDKILILGVC